MLGIEYGKLVSVIVPVYNASDFLKRCIDSLLGQTYENLEIILVDDGSTDGSGDICDQYGAGSEKVRVIHKENGGVSSARNMGMDYARGEYFVFVDSDDYTHREMIEIYVQALDRNKVMLCEITGEKSRLSASYIHEWKDRTKDYDRKKFMQFYMADHVNSPCDKLYDAEIIREHNLRFDESLSLGEDMLFNLVYFRHAPAEYKVIQCPLYYYQEGRNGSLVNSYKPDLFELQLYMQNALLEFLQACGSWNDNEQRLFYALVWDRLYLTIRIYYDYLKKEKKDAIRKKIKESLEHPYWKILEQECKSRNVMNWKRVLKKFHLRILKECVC